MSLFMALLTVSKAVNEDVWILEGMAKKNDIAV